MTKPNIKVWDYCFFFLSDNKVMQLLVISYNKEFEHYMHMHLMKDKYLRKHNSVTLNRQ